MNENMNTTERNDFSDAHCHLMMDYASGALDEGMALVMASYASISPYAHAQLRYFETIGGALLSKDCDPERMKEDSLAQCLSLLDAIERTGEPETARTPQSVPAFPQSDKIPSPVLQHIAHHAVKLPKWQRVLRGMEIIDIPLSQNDGSHVRLMNIAPGIETPEHRHQGMEVMLVLDGAFTDETGFFEAGNIIIHDDETHHQPVSCPQQGCICIVATESPVRFTKGWLRLFNPFVK